MSSTNGLGKIVDGERRAYRVVQITSSAHVVLDARGRVVDEFEIVECSGGAKGLGTKLAFRYGRLQPGVPDLAGRFAAELNTARRRN